MGFTREQLEKIISEAPEGAEYYTPGYAAEYRKITSGDSYYGFVDNEWVEAIDRWLSIERINKVFKLIELAEQLQEMKIQESKQAEIDNTAQQVSSLAKESERDIEKADDGKWQNGDILYYPNGYSVLLIGFHDSYPVIYDCDPLSTTYKCDYSGELSKEKPLTPEQKQQQIDEKNGALLYEEISRLTPYGRPSWSTLSALNKRAHIGMAKTVDFKGKLESI